MRSLLISLEIHTTFLRLSHLTFRERVLPGLIFKVLNIKQFAFHYVFRLGLIDFYKISNWFWFYWQIKIISVLRGVGAAPAWELVSVPGRHCEAPGGKQIQPGQDHYYKYQAWVIIWLKGCFDESRRWLLSQNFSLMIGTGVAMAFQVNKVNIFSRLLTSLLISHVQISSIVSTLFMCKETSKQPNGDYV